MVEFLGEVGAEEVEFGFVGGEEVGAGVGHCGGRVLSGGLEGVGSSLAGVDS